MKAPSWAPRELVLFWELLESDRKIIRSDESEPASFTAPTRQQQLEAGTLDTSYPIPLELHESVCRALVFDSQMEQVWCELKRKRKSFRHSDTPGPWLPFDSTLANFGLSDDDFEAIVGEELRPKLSYPKSLLFACVKAKSCFDSAPKMTHSERRALYAEIAKTAKKLCRLMLRVQGIEQSIVWDTRTYVEPDKLDAIVEELYSDVAKGRVDAKSYSMHVRGVLSLLPLVPELLDAIRKRAPEWGRQKFGVGQPRAASAEGIYFVRYLSSYFLASYGERMHAMVAIIANIILHTNFDRDSVKAIVHQQKTSQRSKE